MKNALLLLVLGLLMNCTRKEQSIDRFKRDALVKNYDLLNFSRRSHPVLISINEFFDGNNDEASIAPSLEKKPEIAEFYKVLNTIAQNPKNDAAFVEVKDINVYANGKLDDSQWFYSDIIYFIGDLTTEEIREATRSLMPDKVEYDTDSSTLELRERFKGKKVVYVWWD